LKVLEQKDRLLGLENRVCCAAETEANALSDLRSILNLMKDGFSRNENGLCERMAVAEAILSTLGLEYSRLEERFTTKVERVMDEMRELRSLQRNMSRELKSVHARQGDADDQGQRTAQSVVSVQERLAGIGSDIESVRSRLQALDHLSDESSRLTSEMNCVRTNGRAVETRLLNECRGLNENQRN
jgi:chromosome segregation ATPase